MRKLVLALALVLIMSVPAMARFTPNLPTDWNGNVPPSVIWDGSTWLVDTITVSGSGINVGNVAENDSVTVRHTVNSPSRSTGFDTDVLGGTYAVLIDLGDTYDWIYVTADTDVLVSLYYEGMSDTSARSFGDRLADGATMIYNFATRYLNISPVSTDYGEISDLFYVRVRGMKQ